MVKGETTLRLRAVITTERRNTSPPKIQTCFSIQRRHEHPRDIDLVSNELESLFPRTRSGDGAGGYALKCLISCFDSSIANRVRT